MAHSMRTKLAVKESEQHPVSLLLTLITLNTFNTKL